ncbi:MAG: hypothetical protein LBG60_07935 [Bifidobacteriaceae bacterium]|jgi:hypothetical protein|nr:hypothetical protein [Bifidobacteriaceae bacterium]
MNTSTVPPGVRAYAQAVRVALTGLRPDQVQDLTDSLELDLMDALTDASADTPTDVLPTVSTAADAASSPHAPGLAQAGPDAASSPRAPGSAPAVPQSGGELSLEAVAERFGAPREYADEMRAAADLPPRADLTGALDGATLSDADGLAPAAAPVRPSVGLREWWRLSTARWQDRSGWRVATWLARALRPVWWVARALAIVGLFYSLVGSPFLAVIAFCVVTALSLAAGRIDWRAKPLWARIGLAAVNTVTALVGGYWVLGGLIYGYWDNSGAQGAGGSHIDLGANPAAPWGPGDPTDYCLSGGLCLGLEPVTNIFAFDAEGNPLEGVQLFDATGRPLNIDPGLVGDELPPDLIWYWTYHSPTGETYVGVPAAAAGDPDDQLWNVFPQAVHSWQLNEATGIWEQADAGEPALVPPFPARPAQVDPSSLPGANTPTRIPAQATSTPTPTEDNPEPGATPSAD